MSKKKENKPSDLNKYFEDLDLNKHFKDDDTSLDKCLTVQSQNVQGDPYNLFYDDSSSEEDYDEIMLNNSSDSTREIFNLNAKRSFSKELKNSNIEIQLSVFLHEIGNRLINSKEVNEIYYPLKKEKIPQKKVLTDSQLEDIISKAFDATFNEIYPDSNELKENNKDAILKFQKYVLENKRKFVKNIRDTLEIVKNELDLNLPDESIDKTVVIDCINAIYKRMRVKLNKKPKLDKGTKNKLKKCETFNDIEKIIIKELISLNSRMAKNVENFADDLINNNKFENIIFDKTKEFISLLKKRIINNFECVSSQHIVRNTLDNGSEIILDECGPKSLAQIRLMNRSDIRKIKNLQAQKNNIFGDKLSSDVKLIKFQNSKETISERVQCNVSGAKISILDSLSSYSNISNAIDGIKRVFSIDDKKIVEIIKSRLKGQVLNIDFPDEISSTEKNQFEKFISAFTYLLFGVEVSRNPKSLLTHQMLLELIEIGNLTWSEALESMPMSIEKAVQASRWQHSNYKTLFPYKYDNADGKCNEILKNLIEKEANIFKKWLSLKGITIGRNGIDLASILEVIIKSGNEWYGINLVAGMSKEFIYYIQKEGIIDEDEVEKLKMPICNLFCSALESGLALDEVQDELLSFYYALSSENNYAEDFSYCLGEFMDAYLNLACNNVIVADLNNFYQLLEQELYNYSDTSSTMNSNDF